MPLWKQNISKDEEAGLLRQVETEPIRQETRLVRLWLADNGIGIEDEQREKIFGLFQRLHTADEYPGTGIGLAIVRKGAERMGGHVGVQSNSGHGSRFWLELPAASKRSREIHSQAA